jgi:hypothetical protein
MRVDRRRYNSLMRRLVLLLGMCLALFGAAFAARIAFVPDVVAVAYAEAPQSIWALETAFVLQSIENVALAGAAIVLALIIGTALRPLIRHSPPNAADPPPRTAPSLPQGQETQRRPVDRETAYRVPPGCLLISHAWST